MTDGAAVVWVGLERSGEEHLTDLATEAGITPLLLGEGPFHVFAVPNQVFTEVQAVLDLAGVNINFVEALKADPNLVDIMKNHYIDGLIVCSCTASSGVFTSAAGFPLNIIVDPDEDIFSVNGLDEVDGFTTNNAVIDVIPGILFPPGTVPGFLL